MYLDLEVEIRGDIVTPRKDDDANEMLDNFVLEFDNFLKEKYSALEVSVSEQDRDDGSED